MPDTSPAQVLCGTQGSDQGQCRQRHIELPGSNLPEPPNGWPDIRGLNQLQASREEWLNGDALDKALKVYQNSLPKLARDMIHIADTSIEGIFGTSQKTFEDILTRNYGRFCRSLKRTEYTLWPLNIYGNHWELGVIRKANPTKKDEGWTRIVQLGIVDSWEDKQRGPRRQFAESRLQRFLRKNQFTFARDHQRYISTARQLDAWSCGLRTFWAARHVMNRIVDMVQGDVYHYNENLWEGMTGWFNPDLVRWEMIGLTAYEAVREMGYRARIAVEVVRTARDGAEDVDAATLMEPPEGGDSVVVYNAETRKRGREDDDEALPSTSRRKTQKLAVSNKPKVAPDYTPADNYEAFEKKTNPVFPPQAGRKTRSLPTTKTPAQDQEGAQTASTRGRDTRVRRRGERGGRGNRSNRGNRANRGRN
ncbi:uncharacterized protein F4817DRAFT_369209 [Daldinia loculata]|uniref:uncharacterized protein n=1 Tax=Daldinia loculata TaxID=103429 RepID=UPI0020C4EEBD|nr:uncharacterized protein F4817DRAFT_369209 [Daldinia loculata]KAI1642573.1 hypothetical protein F4817DRAFT_369209 [Daldinia loculata]